MPCIASTDRNVPLTLIYGFLVGLWACSSAQDLEDIRRAAERGDADAQFRLGSFYGNGAGVPQDTAAARPSRDTPTRRASSE